MIGLPISMNDGQIKYNDSMGQVIAQYANDIRFRNYLEIGTWNGGGSTYCFAKGFENRDPSSFCFASLEINKQLYEIAKEKYKDIKYIHIENASILKWEDFPTHINELLELFENINTEWLKDDLSSLNSAKYMDFAEFTPDVVLLDGSEYLTYLEYKKLESSIKVFILDDINTEKCKKIVEELENNSSWKMKFMERNQRNGWSVFEKIDLVCK